MIREKSFRPLQDISSNKLIHGKSIPVSHEVYEHIKEMVKNKKQIIKPKKRDIDKAVRGIEVCLNMFDSNRNKILYFEKLIAEEEKIPELKQKYKECLDLLLINDQVMSKLFNKRGDICLILYLIKKVCDNPNCKRIFYSMNRNKKHCSTNCEHLMRQRRFRRNN